MPSDGWTEMPFNHAVQVNPPVTLAKGTVYPFVEMAAVDSASRSVCESEHRAFKNGGAKFMPGDTLMARITPCLENGKIARFRPSDTTSPGFGSTEFIVVRGRNGVTDSDFAYYLTKWPDFRQYAISQMTGSSGRQRVPAESLAHFEVPVPPLDVQRRIACILGSLDDKIELNRRMNRTLERMAQALFKSWFIDFDPVRAKADPHNGDPTAGGLPDHLAALFPDRLTDSDLGPIPEGWEVKALTDAIAINPKRTLPKGTRAPFLEMSNMPTRGPSPDSWRLREMTSGMKFINGDTLVARITPCLENGKTAFVDFLRAGQVGWGSTEYIVLRPKEGIPPVLAYLLARTPRFRTFAIRQMTGSSGRQRVPPLSLSKFQMVLPEDDSPVYRAFGDEVQPFFDRITLAVRQSRRLAQLRDTLLPKLLSGELDLPAAEGVVEEVA